MSWSFNVAGTPEGIIKAMDGESLRLTGESRIEFDAAKPHLIGLLRLNVAAPTPAIRLTASGHAYKQSDGTVSYSNCSVRIEGIGTICL